MGFPRGLYLLAKTAKFLNLAFKIDKLKTKYKNSARAKSEKLATIYTLRFIHKTVAINIELLLKLNISLIQKPASLNLNFL